MNHDPAAGVRRPSRALSVLMAAATLASFAVLVGLGTWQVQRLQWKEALLATIDARIGSPPVPVAELDDPARQNGALDYLPVIAHGTFLHEQEMFLLATLDGRSGWHIYTPLALSPADKTASAGLVIVNRGFVPYDRRDPASRPGSQPEGEVEVSGLAREILLEKPSFIVPDNSPVERIFHWKDWSAMVEAAGLDPSRTASYFVDAGPTPAGQLPIGGVTIVNLPNNHLQYAVTWYGLAAALAGVSGVWIVRRFRSPPPPRP